MNKKLKLETVEHSCLPGDLHVAVYVTERTGEKAVSSSAWRRREKGYGRKLLAEMVSSHLGNGNFRVEGKEGEKPEAYLDNRPVEVSISHCPGLCGAALSTRRSVGIDIEHAGRKVHPLLGQRILSSEERVICSDMPVLQLWTVKESTLKWFGSGLRHPMNRLSIVNVDGKRLTVRLRNGQLAECCSFRFGEYWLAVTFDSDREVLPGI